jgi:hypothetical protein
MAVKIRRVLHKHTPFLPDLLKKTARENSLYQGIKFQSTGTRTEGTAPVLPYRICIDPENELPVQGLSHAGRNQSVRVKSP